MELEIPLESLVVNLSTNPPTVYSGKKLSRLVDGAAGKLHSLHLPLDASIGLVGVNSAAFMIAMLGTHKTQHLCVPINYKLPKDKIKFCIEDSNVKFVFCDPEFKHLVPPGITVVELGKEFEQFCNNDYLAPVGLDPDRLCMALYTSGTTGLPKKILFSFRDRFSESVKNKLLSYGGVKMKTLSANPFFHNAGINWFVSHIVRKNTIFLMPQFDAKQFLKNIEKYQITSISVVTPMMLMMLNETDLISTLNLTSIKEITFQASLADASTIEKVKKVFVNAVYIRNPYGLTETGMSVFDLHPEGIPIPPGSAGYPTPLVRTKLVDDVLYVKSEDLLSRLSDSKDEYFNTRDRFRVDQQGFYYYIGRADDMLKCGGEKVFPIEIESVLDQHACVDSSLVIGLDDSIKGQKPYAFVKLKTHIDEADLLKYAAENLATYQIPKRIWQVESWPLNEIGKLDKKTLVKIAQQYIQHEL